MKNEIVYKKLTDEEWNAISKFTGDNKLDEVFDIMCDENGDYFWDFEECCAMPFEVGLGYMADNIWSDGVCFAYYDKEYRHLIQNIFDKYCENDTVKNYVRNVNLVLDNRNKM